MTNLQDEIDSLAEVVLQICRGLDLLTVKEGSTCVVLHENCCFNKNALGLVREEIKKKTKGRSYLDTIRKSFTMV